MARRTKPLDEYLRVMLVAACLADELKVSRTGWGLARWFEADQHLPKHSVDEKSWRRFLDGHKPHQNRLNKIFAAAPLVKSLFDHPFWVALSLSCTKAESAKMLESFGFTPGYKDGRWSEHTPVLSTLDRIACLLAMLNCENSLYHPLEIGRRLCVEYVEICDDRLWSDYSGNLLLLIRMKMQMAVQSQYGLSEIEVPAALKFWGFIKEDFFQNEPIATACAWSAWRDAVYNLDWRDQFRLREFIIYRNGPRQHQVDEVDQRVYRKVRARMYRALNKSEK